MICLFCKNKRDESEEHVFGAPFGTVGFIVRFVCKACNDKLGNSVDYLADRDALLSHARQTAGLPTRWQSIKSVDDAIEADGSLLKAKFDKRELASVVQPQRDRNKQLVASREYMQKTIADGFKAEFRKQKQDLSATELADVVEKSLALFDAADVGTSVAYTHRGLTVTLEKFSLPNDTATATRHNVRGAIDRVSAKIALEVAASTIGVDVLLGGAYDDLRSFTLNGTPDMSGSIEILREPDLEGGDTIQNHVVRLEEREGRLIAVIEFFSAYIVGVDIGPAAGLRQPWAEELKVLAP